MKSPSKFSGGRSTASQTPDRASNASSSAYSSSSSQRSNSRRNPVKVAARSVKGVFVACFTPPESENTRDFSVYDTPSGKDCFLFAQNSTKMNTHTLTHTSL